MTDVPKEIKEFDELLKKAKRIENAIQLNSTGAFIAAAHAPENGLVSDGGDGIDYAKLEDDETRAKVLNGLSENIGEQAKGHFASELDLTDKLKADGLTSAYNGTTYGATQRLMNEQKGNFSLDVFSQYVSQSMRSVEQRHRTTASGMLTDDHIKPLIDYKGLGEIVDPDKMKIGDAIQVVMMNEQSLRQNQTTLTKEQIKNIFQQQDQPVPIYVRD